LHPIFAIDEPMHLQAPKPRDSKATSPKTESARTSISRSFHTAWTQSDLQTQALTRPLTPGRWKRRDTGTRFGNHLQRVLKRTPGIVTSLPRAGRQGEKPPPNLIVCSPLPCSTRRKGVLDQAFRRRRAAGCADHVDQGTQRGRDLPMAGIIQKQSLDGWRPILQDTVQLS